jgi:Na+-translocating ferredoxin:NAD+ oxidoreductase subunit B
MTFMSTDNDIYRALQQHLDSQAIGFPSVKSGADIRLLKRLFTPEEAQLALHLTYKTAPTHDVVKLAAAEFPAGQAGRLLESMFAKGAIGWKKKDGADHWYLMPMVVGMYEQQDGNPSREFLGDADAYMKSLSFGRSFINVKPSQMRTIPIGKSIPVEHHVASYDQVRALVDGSPGPFVVLPCICRTSKGMKGAPCAKTARRETCLAFGDMAAGVLRRGHGREIGRDEVLEILRQNEEDGLVVQPSNTQRADFICSCCGCCCGMLSFQKFMPRPLDFWTSSYHAEVNAGACSQCGTCVTRCQVNAVSLDGPSGEARVNVERCIGCGLCVTTCPSDAISLKQREQAAVPPLNEEELLEQIKANKKGTLGQVKTVVKVAIDKMRP